MRQISTTGFNEINISHVGPITRISSNEYNLERNLCMCISSRMWTDVRGHTKDSKQVLPSREKWVTEVVSEDKDTISVREARKFFESVQGGIFRYLCSMFSFSKRKFFIQFSEAFFSNIIGKYSR